MDASRGFFCLRGGLPTSSSSGATAGKGLATPVRSFVSANSRQTTIFPRIAIVSKQQPSLSLVIRFSRSRIARGRGVGCAYDGSLMLFFPPKTPSSIEPPTSPPLQLRCGKPQSAASILSPAAPKVSPSNLSSSRHSEDGILTLSKL